MPNLFKDILPSILYTKEDCLRLPSDEKDYVPFIINRALSYHLDCIPFANEMNRRPNLDKIMQYHFYLNSVRKRRRPFVPWIKKSQDENLELVKKYFGLSYKKAMSALEILTENQLKEIRESMDIGGRV